MANSSLNVPVVVRAISLSASSIPIGWSPAYTQYILSQAVDFTSVAEKANEAGEGAYEAQVRNDEQDLILEDHEERITQAELDISSLDDRLTSAENKISDHETRISALELDLSNYKSYMNRQKSEVVYSGISLLIPTTSTNLLTLISSLSPTSGSLLPFFVIATGRLKALNKFKNLDFKINIRGTYTSSSGNRSMQMTFGTVVPDTIVVTRDAVTTIDDVFINTFFAVDEGDDITNPGITMMIKANGSTFTATQIKIIATQ